MALRNDDYVTVVNHRAYYPGELDSFDRVVLGVRRVMMARREFSDITGWSLPPQPFNVNPLNVMPVHDLPAFMEGYFD